MIIKAAKRIFNSDKICRSYSDLNFGVTFLEHSVHSRNMQTPCRKRVNQDCAHRPTLWHSATEPCTVDFVFAW